MILSDISYVIPESFLHFVLCLLGSVFVGRDAPWGEEEAGKSTLFSILVNFSVDMRL